jgi:ER lumen protein retaining receptor
MKIFFLGSAFYILYLMKVQFKNTWDPALDTIPLEYLIGPCALLALLIHPSFTVVQVLWSFSVYLEAVAILPQLFQLSKTGEAETITVHYLGALGAYRGLYILNWIYRYMAKEHHVDWISIVAGIVQTALYSDFLYIYFTRVMRGKKFRLPA